MLVGRGSEPVMRDWLAERVQVAWVAAWGERGRESSIGWKIPGPRSWRAGPEAREGLSDRAGQPKARPCPVPPQDLEEGVSFLPSFPNAVLPAVGHSPREV